MCQLPSCGEISVGRVLAGREIERKNIAGVLGPEPTAFGLDDAVEESRVRYYVSMIATS